MQRRGFIRRLLAWLGFAPVASKVWQVTTTFRVRPFELKECSVKAVDPMIDPFALSLSFGYTPGDIGNLTFNQIQHLQPHSVYLIGPDGSSIPCPGHWDDEARVFRFDDPIRLTTPIVID